MVCLRRLREQSDRVPKAMSKKRRMGCEPRVIEDLPLQRTGDGPEERGTVLEKMIERKNE